METNKIYLGDCLSVLKTFPSESINCLMTSPPYWALRDYGVEGQLGLEPTFQEYVNKLCDIFDEVKRVLIKDGTVWVNIGDTYSGSGKGATTNKSNAKEIYVPNQKPKTIKQLEDKSLCNIPARFSIEMQNRGWILRNTIIWHKPNCMPSSVKDRFTVNFEYLFFFVKNKNYWFETQYDIAVSGTDLGILRSKKQANLNTPSILKRQSEGIDTTGNGFKNKRAVWEINTKPFSEAHFATYPEELCETPIKAGCPEFICNQCGKAREKIIELGSIISKGGSDNSKMSNNKESYCFCTNKCKSIEKGYSDCGCNAGFSGGIVLDPFFGAGTTGLVTLKQNKKFVGIELNPKYIEIANKRLKPYLEQKRLDNGKA